MKGTFKSVIGTLNYSILDNGLIILKGEKLRFDRQEYRLTARIEPVGWEGQENTRARVITLIPKFPDKFKDQSCRDALEEDLPKAWLSYTKKHPSVAFVSNRTRSERERQRLLASLQDSINKLDVMVTSLKAEFKLLAELK